jgi:holo-[acyl-carrier protein] synthase
VPSPFGRAGVFQAARSAQALGTRARDRWSGRAARWDAGTWQAWHVIVGIGVDITQVSRLTDALRRTPRLAERLFAESERGCGPRALAGSFAAKEALAKALGAPRELRWTDVAVLRDEATGRPKLEVHGTAAEAAAAAGVRRWHLSLSHDGGICVAMVVAEG